MFTAARLRRAIVPAAVCITLVLASPAYAASPFGSDLSVAPNGTPVPNSSHVVHHSTAPTTGALVAITVRHGVSGANPGAISFRIFSGTSPNFSARIVERLADLTLVNAVPGTVTLQPKDGNGTPHGVPIAAGERIGFAQVGGGGGQTLTLAANNPGSARANAPSTSLNQQLYTITQNADITIQGLIEPDVDLDGYGDESQDTSPSACRGLTVTKLGTPGNDVIDGTAGNDVISTGGGDDIVRGLGGDDIICGGDGNDKIKGGAGRDRLYGEAGRDKLRGGGSKDFCVGGADKDAIGCEKAKQN